VKRFARLPVRLDHQLDEALLRDREGKAAAELDRRDAQHGPEMPSEALG
jgi:hypothetical protein